MFVSKRKSSHVWQFYDKNVIEKTVQCKLCKSNFKDFGNTTNLLKYLKKIHPLRYSTAIEGSNFSIGEESDVQSEHDVSKNSTSCV